MKRYGGFFLAAVLVWAPVAFLYTDAFGDFRRGSRYTLMSSETIGVPETISGLLAWYDASDGSTVAGTTSVTQWNDKSPNSNNLTILDANNGPDHTAVDQNSKDCMDFDHTNTEYLSNNALSSAPASWTMFVVAKANSANGIPLSSRSSVAGTGGSGTRWDWRLQGSGDQWRIAVNSAELTASVTTLDTTAFHLHVAVLPSAGAARTWLDAVVETDAESYIPNPLTDLNVGIWHDETLPADVTICEVIFYANAVSDDDRRTLEDYLQAKWNTAAIDRGEGYLNEDGGWFLAEDGFRYLIE